MNNKEFKGLFGEIAKSYDFKQAFGGWYKESAECIAVLELQKSSFSDSYYLNIKVFIQGSFNNIYIPTKDLIKSSLGDITNQIRDKEVLNLDNSIDSNERRKLVEDLFKSSIVPFVNNTLSKDNIKNMAEKEQIVLLPAVKKELEKLISS